MTINEMRCIQEAIRNARVAIDCLAEREDVSYPRFKDEDFRKMFYQLNDMSLAISDKIKAAEAAASK